MELPDNLTGKTMVERIARAIKLRVDCETFEISTALSLEIASDAIEVMRRPTKLPRTVIGDVDWDELRRTPCATIPMDEVEVERLNAITNARTEERERCAQRCEEVGPQDSPLKLVAQGFAEEIRALGDEG